MNSMPNLDFCAGIGFPEHVHPITTEFNRMDVVHGRRVGSTAAAKAWAYSVLGPPSQPRPVPVLPPAAAPEPKPEAACGPEALGPAGTPSTPEPPKKKTRVTRKSIPEPSSAVASSAGSPFDVKMDTVSMKPYRIVDGTTEYGEIIDPTGCTAADDWMAVTAKFGDLNLPVPSLTVKEYLLTKSGAAVRQCKPMAQPNSRKGAAETYYKEKFGDEMLRAYFSKDRGEGIIRILFGKTQKCQIQIRLVGSKERAGQMAADMCKQVVAGSLDIDTMQYKRDEMLKALPAVPPQSRAKAKSATTAVKRPAAAAAAAAAEEDEDEAEEEEEEAEEEDAIEEASDEEEEEEEAEG